VTNNDHASVARHAIHAQANQHADDSKRTSPHRDHRKAAAATWQAAMTWPMSNDVLP